MQRTKIKSVVQEMVDLTVELHPYLVSMASRLGVYSLNLWYRYIYFYMENTDISISIRDISILIRNISNYTIHI